MSQISPHKASSVVELEWVQSSYVAKHGCLVGVSLQSVAVGCIVDVVMPVGLGKFRRY